MELQALLVLGGVAVAGIAVLLLMGLFSNSGTSYEEAIAQQRRATTELLALAENKNKPKKSNKKANKKLAKKEKSKENVAVTTASEPDSEAPAESGGEDDLVPVIKTHVDFCPPVVVDVPRDTPPNVKIRKRGKDPKVKPILINKEDPSCVSDPSMLPASADNTVTNHFEEMHPKDDFELLHSTLIAEKTPDKKEEIVEKKESKVSKSAKNLKSTPKPTAPVEVVKEEVSRERHNSGDAPKEQRKAKKVEKKSISEEVVVEAAREEVVPPLNAPQPTELTTDKLLKQAMTAAAAPASPAPSPPASKNKKKKTEPNVLTLMAGDSGGVNVGELVRVVREAVLSRTEIQILTDALLNKHHDPLPEHSEWTEGPNDPMQKMKKQLADKEKALADEIEASKALHAKVKELRSSLNAEHARAAAASRAAEAGAATLHARLQRLLEDNHALAQDKLMLQSKLGAEGEAQAQRVQMEMHIQRLSEAEAGLSQQVVGLQAEAGARALEAGQARMEAAAARDAHILAQQHAADLAQQLQETSRACAELEQQRQCAALAEQHLQQELRQLQERLAGMAELQNEVQRQANRAQAAESNADKIKEELEKQKKQLSNELTSLREQLAERESKSAKSESESAKRESESAKRESESVKRESELANRESELVERQSELGKRESELAKRQSELAEREAELAKRQLELAERETELAELKQMKVVPAQNGLPAANNTEQHKGAELAMVESVVEALRGELETARAAARDQREQLDRLRDQLATYQDKNNELRTKNWKVMEALQSAEKALQMKSASALPAQDSLRVAIEKAQESQYNEVASVLRAACPFAAPATRVGREWLQTFVDNLKKELAKKELEKQEVEKKVVETTESPANNERFEDLLSQNEHLQGLVDKYKTIIDDTEEVLSSLQQKVSREEQQWSQQLADKQRELDELRQRTLHQMQTKIDSLQEELQKAQKPNHNHSFADAERLTEERLMAGLTEKLNVDFSNGPLQVGIEKK